jgi:aryl-alcohol dehydrogenase-like predicted oxidoreductase
LFSGRFPADNGGTTEFRQLGRSGIKVSTLTLGTMMFGGPTDEATAARIIDKAHEQGVNSIDTADVYAGSESERVVGRCIARQRERWVLATKFASQLGNGDVNAGGASRKYVARAVEASLKRLNPTTSICSTSTPKITTCRSTKRCVR